EDLIQFGGHARAAGFSMRSEYIDSFRRSFVEAVRVLGAEAAPESILPADAVLRLSSVGPRLTHLTAQFEPTGAANSLPTFVSRDLRVLAADTVRGGHMQLRLHQGTAIRRAIAFRPQFDRPEPGSHIDVLYTVKEDVWQGESR